MSLLWLHLVGRSGSNEKGQDVVEYAALVVLIALVVIVGVTAFGTQMSTTYGHLVSRVGAFIK